MKSEESEERRKKEKYT